MKRLVPALVGLALASALVWTLFFLYQKSQDKPQHFETEAPESREIVLKTVATGAIEPRQQIDIKPRVSGVISELAVEPGDAVSAGQKLATIQIIPNMVSLNSAESALRSAQISYRSAKEEFQRNNRLFSQGIISQTELAQFELNYQLRQQDVQAAKSNLQLIKSGAASGGNKVSNLVTSTVEGMIIEVPIEIGTSVTEANTFNEGTTIATVANMKDMIFIGQVDESEVGKIKIGLPLRIRIGALDDQHFEGSLEYISPKGALVDGAIQFEVKAAINLSEDDFIRAGYSANADIVLDRRDEVLAIREALVSFREGKSFVEVETGPQTFEERAVELGLSDGIFVEVLSGVTTDDQLKRPVRVRGSAR